MIFYTPLYLRKHRFRKFIYRILYIGIAFLPVKSENKKICKEVDENQRLWYDKKKSIRGGFYAKRVGKVRKTIGGGN